MRSEYLERIGEENRDRFLKRIFQTIRGRTNMWNLFFFLIRKVGMNILEVLGSENKKKKKKNTLSLT